MVVEAANAGLKLLPGMTANLSFQIEKHAGVLALPNAALRFHPKPEQVRIERPGRSSRASPTTTRPIRATVSAPARERHYVWVLEDGLLAAVEVGTGLSDKNSTELVSEKLAEGREVVVGAQGSAAAAAKKSSPPPPPPM